MSVDLIIKEDRVPQELDGVARLRIPKSDRGTTDWLPEQDCTRGEITITANGVYKAVDSGVYGFSKAVVNVDRSSGAVGNGQDGKYYKVTVEDGEFVWTEVPKSIAVTAPPTKTAYRPGEALSYTGIAVTVYAADGTPWDDSATPGGAVPYGELIFIQSRAEETSVPVLWLCPQSGQLLRASFSITISEEAGS